MKRLILSIVCAFATTCISAQNVIYDNGSTKVYENGMVYCSGGFVCIETKIPNTSETCLGLYTSDGTVLVSGYDNNGHSSNKFRIEEGTVVIAQNAFIQKLSTLYIPTSVRYISPSVFSYKYVIGDSSSSINMTKAESGSMEEVARYNLKGEKLQSPQRGLNIIQYSNNTSKKVVVK